MKDKAIQYLIKNPILHMGMIEPIRRGSADILYAGIDGVLIKEQKSNAYMISVDNLKKGQQLLNSIVKCEAIVTHQQYMVEYILNKFGLTKSLECFQAAYMGKTKLQVKEELEIRRLEQEQIEIVLEHYNKISRKELGELLRSGSLFGGYKGGELIGFIGNHLEGSIGLLEVFHQYRRLGYASMLEAYMVNRMLEKGLVPFGQIVSDNEKSMALHKKLGFEISEDKLYWLF